MGRRERQPSASNDIPESGGRIRVRAQGDSRPIQPWVSSHGGGNISGEEGATFHPSSRYQQNVPPNAFGKIGDMYPTPPTAWQNESDTPNHYRYQDPQPSSFRSYGSLSWSTQTGQRNVSNISARRSQQPGFELQTYPPLWDLGHSARPVPQPLQRSLEYGISGWHRDPAGSAVGQQFTPSANELSPYAANVPNSNVYLQPQSNARPHGRRLKAQPSQSHPTMPTVGDEVEDREESFEQGEKGKTCENQELTTTKMTNMSRRASKVQEDGHRGLTRVNGDDELEWLAKADSEGGKVLSMHVLLSVN